MIQTTTYHPAPTIVRKSSHSCTLPSELRRMIGDGSIVGTGEVGVSLPVTSVAPITTTGELGTEGDERERLTYGLGDGFGDSICGDSGAGATSTSSGGVYVSSGTALGGGRSTIASRSYNKPRQQIRSSIWVAKQDELTSFRRSSPAYSPSISSGPRRTAPLRKTSPSSSTQLRDLLVCSDQHQAATRTRGGFRLLTYQPSARFPLQGVSLVL